MHAEALEAARVLFQGDEIIDPGNFFSSGRAAELFRQAVEFDSSLRKALKGQSAPWLRSLDSGVIRPVVYAYLRVSGLLDALKDKVDLPSASVYPSFSRHHLSFAVRLEQRIMEDALSRLAQGRRSGTSNLGDRIRRYAAISAGCMLNASAGLWVKKAGSLPVCRSKKTSIMVAGLLSTDEHAQRMLVRRLHEEIGDEVEWYCYAAGDKELSHDERMREDEQSTMTPVDWRKIVSWRFARAETWSRMHACCFLEKIIIQNGLADELSMSADAPASLARLIIHVHEPLRLTYEGIRRLLDPVGPSVMVGDCNCGAMAFVREWARENHIYYVKLPHGFEYDVEDDYEWDNDVTGVLGRWLLNPVAKAFPGNKRFYAAGGVHLAEQVDRGREIPDKLPTSKTICLLASDHAMTDYPDKDVEQHDDIIGMANELSLRGFRLSIRCHPRSRRKWFYRQVAEHAAQEGIEIIISDTKASLREELDSIAAAVMRLASSSALVAMYKQVPLIGWIPRPSYGGSDRFLHGLPLHSNSCSQIAGFAETLALDLSARQQVLRQQQDYLAELVEDPWGDPWQRSVEVILQQLREEERALS